MFKLPKPNRYYELRKKSEADTTKKKEYEELLKQLSNKTNSADYFKEGSLYYNERKKLHDEILNSMLSQYRGVNKPTIHFLLGSIGSGKTSVKDRIYENEKERNNFIFLNFDDLKKRLPEYELLKNLNPKKAAQFVQSESAKLAGKLFKKALQKKCNIIFEKNIRKNKAGKFHLEEEIGKAIQKNYTVYIHIIFLDNYERAWERVQKRAEKIRRFVQKSEVKETFETLFPYFNILYKKLSKKPFSIYFWYNGFNNEEKSSDKMKGLVFLSGIFNQIFLPHSNFQNNNLPLKKIQKTELYSGFILKDHWDILPPKAQKTLKKLDFFKKNL